ncbi:MAG: DUF2497 domain-containing protein [Rhodospirillales bacterium]|nr:DUF2497 domain-containing protein [Rhodospirillales bacterium]
MPDKKPDQEPSIEEILASIRQIISDEDGEGASAPPASDAPSSVPESPVPPANDDVIDLTEKIEPEPEVEPIPSFLEDPVEEAPPAAPLPEPDPIHVDLREQEEDVSALPPSEPEPPDFDNVPETPEDVPDSILTDRAAGAALAAFSKLTGSMPIRSPDSPGQGTLEDIVRDMLRPMLRTWLDDNLPPIIERLVRRELEKLARQAMED